MSNTRREVQGEVLKQIKAEGILQKRKLQVYETLCNLGAMTQNELIRVFGSHMANGLRARFSELEKMNAIRTTGIRKCKVTGRNVHEWEVTGLVPTKLEKPVKIKCEHCNGKGHFVEIQQKLL